VVQFLGQDNVFFYCCFKGAMLLGTQPNPHSPAQAGELQ